MGQRFILFIVTCTTAVIPLCWAVVDSSSDKDGETLANGGNEILQTAFQEILDRRRRAASELVVSIKYEKKDNKSVTEFSQTEKDFLLHIHNAYRSAVQPFASNMLEMVWDDDIAAFAQDWANQCKAEHRPIRNLSPWINMGENIYWVYGGKYHEGYATKFWWDEVQWYNYSTKECVAGKVCGHYITMVWAASGKMGCGINRCSRLWALPDIGRGAYYFVCNYSGRFFSSTHPYTEHRTICSHCFRTNAPKCRYNLCVTQEMLDYDIGYNGSTAEIGINRTHTTSSIKSPTTKTPTTAALSSSTSFDTTNTTPSDVTILTSPETTTEISTETSSLTSHETETSVITSPDTTIFSSANTTITTPRDTSNLTYETSESTSISTVKTTFISTINTTTVTLSTMSSINTTSNTTATPMSTSISEPRDTTETTIKYETDDKPFILQAVDEIIEVFNSGNKLSMFSFKTFAGIAIVVALVICN